jgi:phytoene synthase
MNSALEPDSSAQVSIESANSVLARKGRSFHWARHLLGATHASRATRLYRFCRYIDDAADENRSDVLAKQALENVVAALRLGQSDDPIIRDGLSLMRECGIDADVMLDLIEGVQSDLDLVRIADMDSLLRYCYRVAGTVGLMMCKVLDTNVRQAFPHAVDLGIAMQLTNICRDVSADAVVGRRYLPASMVGDLAPERLVNPASELRATLQACVAKLLDCADTYYASGERGLPHLPLRARASMLVAARVYRGIGVQLRARQHVYWTERAHVPPWEKVLITSRALLMTPLKRAFWWPPSQHDAALHLALQNSPALRSAALIRHAV